MSQTIIFGVTSGIAAFKSIELVKELKNEGYDVRVVMTEHAKKMINPKEFEKVSGNLVITELFEKGFDYKKILKNRKVSHVSLAEKADVMVICPATANVIAKSSYGIADDYLTTTALAVTCPIIICPAMNVNMWNNPIVQENLDKLRQRNFHIVNPVKGMLACGYEGMGRLADNQTIKQEIFDCLDQSNSLKGKKIIVTAGGTMEKIDDVRFITNRSSGKMGVAIAEECFLKGAEVLLLRAKNSVSPRYPIEEKMFTTADELLDLVESNVKNYEYFYHAAAVSDFKPEIQSKGKISSKKELIIKLKPQVKILDKIKKINPNIFLIAFKAECISDIKKLTKIAFDRLKESNADVIIANDVGKNNRGFEVDTNEVTVIFKDGTNVFVPLADKHEVARQIVELINTKLSLV